MKKYKVLTKSRGLTIPRDMAAHLDIDAGTAVDLTASGDGKLIITRHIDTCRFCGGAEKVKQFGEGILRDYGKIEDIYADSAEQTLIAGLREYIDPLDLTVKNARKRPIIDRIRATTMLMGGERFLLTSDCETLREAFQGAVYDDKVIGEDVRLDNGTSDIDTLDAFEYSFERYIPRLIRRD